MTVLGTKRQTSEPTAALWDECCEYAQQISEIASVWLRKSAGDLTADQIHGTELEELCQKL